MNIPEVSIHNVLSIFISNGLNLVVSLLSFILKQFLANQMIGNRITAMFE